ncbi:MAG: COX15/CtaA family protein [Thermodesulfobacteriota bacterium]
MLGKLTVFLLFLLLVWGNVVSGLGAGLACPDWPLCYGQYIPPLKWDIILEKGHRVVAALTGGVLIGLCVQRLLRYRGWSRVLPLTAVFFLAIQILLGREVVLLKLPVNITTLHFGMAIAILSLALYMAFHDGAENRPRFSLRGISGVLFVLCFLVLVQSVFGAYVRHSGSGLGCGVDFPRCLGFWIPPHISGSVMIHLTHRLIAYAVLLTVIALTVSALITNNLGRIKNTLFAVLALLLIQVAVGAGVVYTKLHVMGTAFHLLIALLILSAVAYAWFNNMKETGV